MIEYLAIGAMFLLYGLLGIWAWYILISAEEKCFQCGSSLNKFKEKQQ